MEKVYFRDNEKITLLKAMSIMANLGSSLKNEMQFFKIDQIDKMRKIFIKCYTTLGNLSEPELTIKIAEEYEEIGIELDIQNLKMNCVISGIEEARAMQCLSEEQLKMYNKSKVSISNSFIFDMLYEYFEENLKKTIVSEFFKRIFGISYNLDITIKVSSERIDKIFENETIRNKEEFFCQQFQTWSMYNQIAPFVKYEIRKREGSVDKKDIFMNINILKSIVEFAKN